MALTTAVLSNKRKKANKIITDLSNVSQNDDDSDPEASELNLGTKIKTPKDLMLEELSLLNNKASKMFKKRQQRVEKFTVTNQNLQKLQNLLMSPPVPPPKPQMLKQEEVEKTVDEEADKEKKRKEYVRTYISPWERAMKGNEELTATMKVCMPGPMRTHPELPQYKSFNRTALPYGSLDNASKLLSFELPEILTAPEEQEQRSTPQPDICSRPCFNRTPIGWVCSEDISMDLENLPGEGETEDL